jgi:hypothetical protein
MVSLTVPIPVIAGFIVGMVIAFAITFSKKEYRSPKGRRIALHTQIFPYLTFLSVLGAFLVFIEVGSVAFWLLLLPAIILAFVADFRMTEEGNRYLRLKGIMEPPEGKKVVPRDHLLVKVWQGLDVGPGGMMHRSPICLVFKSGDVYDPDPDQRGSELVLIPPGEKRVFRSRRSIGGRIREFSLLNKKGHPKFTYLDAKK